VGSFAASIAADPPVFASACCIPDANACMESLPDPPTPTKSPGTWRAAVPDQGRVHHGDG
jgi:hypothetical protein